MTDIDAIAAAVHETWRALSRAEGWSMPPHLDRPFGELDEPAKNDNRAAADRMADVLAIAGLALTDDPTIPETPPDAFVAELEKMAAAEHDGWMTHRGANGWTWGPTRDNDAKRHPSMRPYSALPESEREKDRSNVRHYPDFAARAGLRITRVL